MGPVKWCHVDVVSMLAITKRQEIRLRTLAGYLGEPKNGRDGVCYGGQYLVVYGCFGQVSRISCKVQ